MRDSSPERDRLIDEARTAYEQEYTKPDGVEYNDLGNYYASTTPGGEAHRPSHGVYQYRWQGWCYGWLRQAIIRGELK